LLGAWQPAQTCGLDFDGAGALGVSDFEAAGAAQASGVPESPFSASCALVAVLLEIGLVPAGAGEPKLGAVNWRRTCSAWHSGIRWIGIGQPLQALELMAATAAFEA